MITSTTNTPRAARAKTDFTPHVCGRTVVGAFRRTPLAVTG